MLYQSTRNEELLLCGAEAILEGLAEDGGLFVPQGAKVPSLDYTKLIRLSSLEIAAHILHALLPEFSLEETLSLAHAAYDGKFANGEEFNKKIHYLFLSCGSEENFGTDKLAQSLRDCGVKVDFQVSPGTHHEWLTWRRGLYQFIPHLFKK